MPAKKTTKTSAKSSKKTKKSVLKDPQGGLTKKGREYFKKTEGANLKPGVKGKADTPEKMRRKGSFLRRHYAHLRGPLVNDKGEPTRLALAAHAWGEPVPKTAAAAKKLADKGTTLLERYEKSKEKTKTSVRTKKTATRKKKTKTARKAKTLSRKTKTTGAKSARKKTVKRPRTNKQAQKKSTTKTQSKARSSVQKKKKTRTKKAA